MSRNVTFMLDARGEWLNQLRGNKLDKTKLFWALQAALIHGLLEKLLPMVKELTASKIVEATEDDALTVYTLRECSIWEMVEKAANVDICCAIMESLCSRCLESVLESTQTLLSEFFEKYSPEAIATDKRFAIGAIEASIPQLTLKGHIALGPCTIRLGDRELQLENAIHFDWQLPVPQVMRLRCELDYTPPEIANFLDLHP